MAAEDVNALQEPAGSRIVWPSGALSKKRLSAKVSNDMPPNKSSDESEPADWFYSAGDRRRVADTAWQRAGLTHSGVELLPEAAARYRKGYLVAQGWRLNRTHDLRKLVQEAQRYDPEFGCCDALAKELTEDFFAQHYPGGDWSSVGSNYETLRAQVSLMLELIQENLPQYFPKPPTK